jgi:hypothetical protein
MTKKHRSRRKEEALAALKAKQKRRNLQIGGISILVLAFLGGLLWLTNRTTGEDLLSDAVGKTWGPVDAPVQIQEWSDYN